MKIPDLPFHNCPQPHLFQPVAGKLRNPCWTPTRRPSLKRRRSVSQARTPVEWDCTDQAVDRIKWRRWHSGYVPRV